MILKRSPFKPEKRVNVKKILIIILIILALPIGFMAGISIKGIFKNFPTFQFNQNTKQTIDNTSQSAETQTVKTVETKEVKAVYLTKKELTPEGINSFIDYAKANDINGVIIDLKATDGILIYDSAIESAKQAGAVSKEPIGLKSIISKLKESGIYTIARLICFRDNTALKNVNLAVQISSGGYWWYYEKWLNPYKKDVWDYLTAVGVEAADMGFDEIMLDEVKFPDEGKLYLISYFEDAQTPKPQAINGFVNYISEEMHRRNVKVSLSTPPKAAYAEGTAESGQSFDFANLKIDYLSPHFEPTSFRVKRGEKIVIGDQTFDAPEKTPAEIITKAMSETANKLKAVNSSIAIRPYLQSYTSYGVVFDKEKIELQASSSKSSGGLGYILYNEQTYKVK